MKPPFWLFWCTQTTSRNNAVSQHIPYHRETCMPFYDVQTVPRNLREIVLIMLDTYNTVLHMFCNNSNRTWLLHSYKKEKKKHLRLIKQIFKLKEMANHEFQHWLVWSDSKSWLKACGAYWLPLTLFRYMSCAKMPLFLWSLMKLLYKVYEAS